MNLLRIAGKALQRNKLRAFLTMLGIIIGVGSVIAMIAIGQGSKKSIQDQLASMGSNMITVRPSSNVSAGARLDFSAVQTLTQTDVDALRKGPPLIKYVSPASSAKGQAIYGNENWPTSIQGVSADYLSIRAWPLQQGASFSAADVASAAKVCLMGQTVAANLFRAGENPVGQVVRFNKIPFRIIGVLAPKGENAFGQDQDDILLTPYTTVEERITGSPFYQSIVASAEDEGSTDAASAEVAAVLRSNHRLKSTDPDDFSIRTQAELIQTFSSTSQLLTVLLAAIAAISLVVGGIGIMNIMYVSVTERTKEIGLRLSVGAKGSDILKQFLVEAVLISITGGIIGVGLGIAGSWAIHSLLHWPIAVAPSSVWLSFLVCAVTGIFFGYYPAQKAAGLDPIEALRYE